MDENILKVGKYNTKFNDILGLKIDELDIYRSKGLPTHMVKSKHFKALKYIDYIPDSIESPDYIHPLLQTIIFLPSSYLPFASVA